MGEARLLWEVGEDGATIQELRVRLGIDSGYASRLIRSLERDGLVRTVVDNDDRRLRRVELTHGGVVERAELDRRSDALADGLLAALEPRERSELVGAMRTVERSLVRAGATIEPADPRGREVRWCFARYVAELDRRFESGFDAGRSLPADPEELVPPAGLVLLARLRGAPAGCGAVKLHPEGVAEIKRMWVAPAARGRGLGARLLGELEARAWQAGATVARLETNRALGEAIGLYRRAGYDEVAPFSAEPYAHHWFQKRLSAAAG
jgi:DNA-binding MarR family transcriptional regulator/GNAT superfamily N-acetyltransferase